jgi:hypothetical protein
MVRRSTIRVAGLILGLSVATAQAHELWFQPPGRDAAAVRLTFGDSPAPGEAERVAEIAQAKVWGDGLPLEVRRLSDGIEARLPARRPAVLSAYADRGVVDYQGDSFVIDLAAYAQSRPIQPDDAPKLGLGDDSLRLLLVADDGGKRAVRATWRGKPAADLVVSVFHGGKPTELRTDARGEVSCPDLANGPVSMLATLKDPTPGRRGGRDYSHTRFKATLMIDAGDAIGPDGPAQRECLARVEEIHGNAGPWAVVGYRIGERARKELGRPRHSFDLAVTHRAPAEVQFSCVVDGLQAATGASLGKLNLKFEERPHKAGDVVPDLSTVVEDRASHHRLTFTLKPDFSRSILNLPFDRLAAEGRRVAALPDDAIFEVRDEAPEENR